MTSIRKAAKGRRRSEGFDVMPSRREADSTVCPLCLHGYERRALTKHHLVPKCRGGVATVLLCRPCHRQLHATYTEKELERRYPTVEALVAAEELQPYVA